MHPSPKISLPDLESGSGLDIEFARPCHTRNSLAKNGGITPWQPRAVDYAKLAAHAANGDGRSAIYQRFERLAARNILHLESELAWLEAKQDKLDKEAEASGGPGVKADELILDDNSDGGLSKELSNELQLHQDHPHPLLPSVLSILAAASFLIGAIVGLYFITRPGYRLLMISLLIAAFAVCLTFMTNASGEGVFLATAAYAAVLVVFVSGNLAASSVLYANGINPNSLGAAGVPATVSVISTVVRADISTVFQTVTQATASVASTSVAAIASPVATPSAVAVKKGLSSGALAGIVAGSLLGVIGLIFVTCLCLPIWQRGGF
ncbi:MAG: hypothetical protein M1839_009130 [Geoglossum umbratile]|nr:MAG: hypothetical protein M1839_009130 [Geoglossum umbratile]